ncbi:MAG TPA: DUF4905 domain-containing protein [Cytophagales bacterium]|nr:DUF4905 domain-containing protein [Cytophagales bacterium]
MPTKLKQNFSFLFKWNIWKIIFDNHLPLMAIELRDLEDKKTDIVLIDYQKANIQAFSAPEMAWLSGPVGMSNGRLLLQKFKDLQFPDPKGFVIFDVFKQQTLVEENDGSFAFFSDNKAITTRIFFDQIIFESYDLVTGIIEELDQETRKKLTPEEVKISLPLQYNEGNVHFSTVSTFVKKCTNKEAIKGVEYLETATTIIVSYYIRAHEKLENFLLITDGEGVVMEDILLDSDLPGMSKDTFFVKDNHLYFVKNKKEIQSYAL